MNSSGYSSTVILTLFICGAELALSHVGSEFFVVRESTTEYESADAEIMISVDGVERKNKVFLPNGIAAGEFIKVTYF